MESSTIAIIILFSVVYILLLCTPAWAAILALTGTFALIFGFFAIIACSMIDGWHLFFALLWEIVWIGVIVLIPQVRKIMGEPH